MRELKLARGARVLDVFTGSGALAVAAGLAGASSVTAVDLLRRAALNARVNGWLNGISVSALRGDLFEPVRDERFDLILANPPYLPGPSEELPRRGPSVAWEGGRDGRALIDRLCGEAADHLRPGGNLLLVQSSLSGERETLDALSFGGLRPEVVARVRGPLGPVAASRAELLEARGSLRAGEREEELLVIHAIAPGP